MAFLILELEINDNQIQYFYLLTSLIPFLNSEPVFSILKFFCLFWNEDYKECFLL